MEHKIKERSNTMKVSKDDVRKAVRELIKTDKLPEGFTLVEAEGAHRVLEDSTGKRWDIQGDKRMKISAWKEELVKICEKCGKEFTPDHLHPYQKYCSECSKSGKKKSAEPVIKKCEKCGKEFTTSLYTPYQKFCSECGKKSNKTGEAMPDKVEVVCSDCGKAFMKSKYLPYITTCDDCRDKVRKDRKAAKSAAKAAAKPKVEKSKASKKSKKSKDSSEMVVDAGVDKPDKTYDEWMTSVNDIIEASVGVTSEDLPDMDYRGSFRAGKPAEQMAAEAVANAE